MKSIFKLNNVKFFAAAIAICGASLLGYNAYSNATMTDQERLFQQNLEALTSDEAGAGYSCTVTVNCSGDSGTISCTGANQCERGGILFWYTWVKCDGKITEC